MQAPAGRRARPSDMRDQHRSRSLQALGCLYVTVETMYPLKCNWLKTAQWNHDVYVTNTQWRSVITPTGLRPREDTKARYLLHQLRDSLSYKTVATDAVQKRVCKNENIVTNLFETFLILQFKTRLIVTCRAYITCLIRRVSNAKPPIRYASNKRCRDENRRRCFWQICNSVANQGPP